MQGRPGADGEPSLQGAEGRVPGPEPPGPTLETGRAPHSGGFSPGSRRPPAPVPGEAHAERRVVCCPSPASSAGPGLGNGGQDTSSSWGSHENRSGAGERGGPLHARPFLSSPAQELSWLLPHTRAGEEAVSAQARWWPEPGPLASCPPFKSHPSPLACASPGSVTFPRPLPGGPPGLHPHLPSSGRG